MSGLVPQPLDMVAPRDAYAVFYVLLVLNLIGTAGWLAWRARSTRSPLPLAALGGGLAVGVVIPPIYNALTLVWFPSNIPLALVTAFGMRDPLFDTLGYALFIGFGGWWLCEWLRDGRGARAVWTAFVLWGVTDLLLELPFLHWGLYRYYGDQPLQIGGFPVHWVFMNGLVPVLAGVLMFLVSEHWPWGREGAALRVAACPAVAGGLLLVPMAPVATALHAETTPTVRILSALASVVISLLAMRAIAGRLAPLDAAKRTTTVAKYAQ